MTSRISSGSPFEAKIGYSRAVVDGDMVYVSGTTGYDYATMTMPEDAGQQARNALGTIAKALAEAGSSLKDVVRVRYYLTDMAWYDALVAAAGEAFVENRPAATMAAATSASYQAMSVR
jgi:enamine deaminase RidA (YjgF/YER057c/UK114 family)